MLCGSYEYGVFVRNVAMIRVLLVEDEEKLAFAVKKGLENADMQADMALDGETGRRYAFERQYDVILLDVNLPKINGVQLCTLLKEAGVQTPVLMLTALDSIEHKLRGFDAGVDDYVVKPFEIRELIARIRVLARRGPTSVPAVPVLRVADLELYPTERLVRRAGNRIDLTAKEYALLEYMMANKGRVLSKGELSERVWDLHFDTGTNVIEVYINFLRKKIDKEAPVKLIHTVVGRGYVLREPS